MRIWHPIPPICLDDKRLLGEHRELHAIWSVLKNDKRGYRNHPETRRWSEHRYMLAMRHDILVKEMERRGWNHKSSIPRPPVPVYIYWPKPWEPIEVMRQNLADKIVASL